MARNQAWENWHSLAPSASGWLRPQMMAILKPPAPREPPLLRPAHLSLILVAVRLTERSLVPDVCLS